MFKEYTKAIAEEMQVQIGKLVLKEVNAENGTFKVVASDETIDRAGEQIKISAWDLTNYMKSPIILFGHDYWSIENIVGRATSVTPEGTQLIIEGVFASTENAQLCRKLYDEGILKTVSVGFIPLERDQANNSIITKAELLELSFVPVPCNPNALSLEKEVIAKMVEFGIVKAIDDEGNEIPNGDTPTDSVDTDKKLEQIEKETKEIKAEPTMADIMAKLDAMPQMIVTMITELETTDPDDNGDVVQDSAKLAEAKEVLQNINKAVSQALHNIKIKKI